MPLAAAGSALRRLARDADEAAAALGRVSRARAAEGARLGRTLTDLARRNQLGEFLAEAAKKMPKRKG